MYYTRSQDGIQRCTVHVEVRLTREQIEKYRKILTAEYGYTPTEGRLKQRIRQEMRNGLNDWDRNYNDAGEYIGE